MKRLMLTILTVFAVVLTALPAQADSRVHAEGEWTYEPTIVSVEEVGPHFTDGLLIDAPTQAALRE